MKLELDTEQLAVRDAIRAALASADVEAVRAAWGRHHLACEYERLGSMEMLALALPEQRNVDLRVGGACLAEELGRRCASTPLVTSIASSAGIILAGSGAGSDLVDPVLRGELIVSTAHYETAATLAAPPATALRPDGAGHRVHGAKRLVEWARASAAFVVTAVAPDGFALVLVAGDADGLGLRPHVTSCGTTLDEVLLDGVAVGASAVIATGARAEAIWRAARRHVLVVQSAYLLGLAERAVELTCEHVKQRHQFGRPIAAFQAVQHRLANAATAALAARLLLWEVVSRPEGGGIDPRRLKAWIAEAVFEVAKTAHMLHGGIGVVDDHEVSLIYRRAQGEAMLYGSPHELWVER